MVTKFGITPPWEGWGAPPMSAVGAKGLRINTLAQLHWQVGSTQRQVASFMCNPHTNIEKNSRFLI